MPEIVWHFLVEYSAQPRDPYAHAVFLSDWEVFCCIRDLGFSEETRAPVTERRGLLKIEAPDGDPRLHKVVNMLAKLGIYPTRHTSTPFQDRHQCFEIIKWRKYSDVELTTSKYLSVLATIPWRVIATVANGKDLTDWQVRVDQRQQSQFTIGTFDCFRSLLVAQPVKDLMERELRNVRFEEVGYDRPEAVIKRLWRFDSEWKMPQCLLQRQDVNGDFLAWGEWGGVWDDAGYKPAELQFRQSEVRGIEPFDVAVTQEWVHGRWGTGHRDVIVSQKFRQLIEREKLKGIAYAPVRLV